MIIQMTLPSCGLEEHCSSNTCSEKYKPSQMKGKPQASVRNFSFMLILAPPVDKVYLCEQSHPVVFKYANIQRDSV